MDIFTNQTIAVLVVAFGLLWMAQMYFAGKQAQAYMGAVRRLRGKGDAATGRARRNRIAHVFVALAADDDGRVVAATRMAGMTLMARPHDWDGPIGHALDDVAGWDDDPDRRAAAQAARFLLGTEAAAEAELSARTQAARRGPTARRRAAP